ncbi:OsmC family protein [Pelobium sp.]|nr:OsmC family protein [Pelobium sp.]MDA9555113.1 OsmC family protein [Pelobium sp.]
MSKITSIIGKELYKVEILSESGNTLIADEPLDNGGKNLGFSPHELLGASLAACTSATLRMYADRKGWDLTEVKSEIEVIWDDSTNSTTINRKLNFIGNLDDSQKERLLVIANKCPIHKILSHSININTSL